MLLRNIIHAPIGTGNPQNTDVLVRRLRCGMAQQGYRDLRRMSNALDQVDREILALKERRAKINERFHSLLTGPGFDRLMQDAFDSMEHPPTVQDLADEFGTHERPDRFDVT